MSSHSVRFFRCVDEPDLHRAICSCGWAITGDQDHVQSRAATHDIDEDQERGRVRSAPLLQGGFVSGLPDDPNPKPNGKSR